MSDNFKSILFILLIIFIAIGVSVKRPINTKRMAEEMFVLKLKKGFLSHRDSSKMRKEALVEIYKEPYWSNRK